MKFTAILLLGFLTFVSTAWSDTANPQTCFFRQTITGFEQATNTSVVVSAMSARYKLTLDFCNELPFAQAIAFDSFGGSSVCTFDHLLVLDQFTGHVIQSCLITNIQQMP